jgi:hypothetical protein
VIRVYDAAGNVIESHEHKGDFKDWCVFTKSECQIVLDLTDPGWVISSVQPTRRCAGNHTKLTGHSSMETNRIFTRHEFEPLHGAIAKLPKI